ncbi:MAG: hypothetical protein WCT77_08550 [Bacteroidota bacterium]
MKIELLIEKYLEGETSPEEECELRDFFSRKNIPKELVHFKTMFSFFTEEKLIEISPEFNPKINLLVEKKILKTDFSNNGRFLKYTGIAASILIVLGISFYLLNTQNVSKNSGNQEPVSMTQERIITSSSDKLLKNSQSSITENSASPDENILTKKHKKSYKSFPKLSKDEKFAFNKTKHVFNVITEQFSKIEQNLNKNNPFEPAMQCINKANSLENVKNKLIQIIGG